MRSKIASYLGFARRAGKLTIGVNAAACAKRCSLLVADESVGKNSRKEIEKLQAKFSCPLVFVKDLGELTGREGAMLAAVREEHLAGAILKELAVNN